MATKKSIIIQSDHGELPFLKDIFVKSLILFGFHIGKAYEIALQVEAKLIEEKKSEITGTKLYRITQSVLKENHEYNLLKRYKKWYHLLHPRKPIILLLTGTSGVGKSTLTSEIAYTLDIKRTIGTDSVREIMRTFFSKALMPWIHHSTFEKNENNEPFVKWYDNDDELLYGYIKQSETVAMGVKPIIQRALCEKLSILIEGVHLLPQLFNAYNQCEQAYFLHVLLDIPDERAHYQNFEKRGLHSGSSRRSRIYLEYFPQIRCIQEYLRETAKELRIPIINSTNLIQARTSLIEELLEKLS